MSLHSRALVILTLLCSFTLVVNASPAPFLWARSHVFPPTGVVPRPRPHATLPSQPSIIRPHHVPPVFPILGSHVYPSGPHIHSPGPHIHPSGSHIHPSGTHIHPSGSHHPSGTHIHPSGSHIHTPGSHIHTSGSHIHTSGSHIHTMSRIRGHY